MNKEIASKHAKPHDKIYILSDKYEKYGISKNYVGIVVDNIKARDSVLADFDDPKKPVKAVSRVFEIKYEDFKIMTDRPEEIKLFNVYRKLFDKN